MGNELDYNKVHTHQMFQQPQASSTHYLFMKFAHYPFCGNNFVMNTLMFQETQVFCKLIKVSKNL